MYFTYIILVVGTTLALLLFLDTVLDSTHGEIPLRGSSPEIAQTYLYPNYIKPNHSGPLTRGGSVPRHEAGPSASVRLRTDQPRDSVLTLCPCSYSWLPPWHPHPARPCPPPARCAPPPPQTRSCVWLRQQRPSSCELTRLDGPTSGTSSYGPTAATGDQVVGRLRN